MLRTLGFVRVRTVTLRPAMTIDQNPKVSTSSTFESMSDNFVRTLSNAWPVKQQYWQPFGSRPKSWKPDLFLVLGTLFITVLLLQQSWLTSLDVWIRKTAYYNKLEPVRELAFNLTYLGSGKLVAPIVLVLALWCALRYRSIRPLLLFGSGFLFLGVILIIKHLFGRPWSQRPFFLENVSQEGPILFSHVDESAGYIGFATAFPSGHAVNSIVLFGLIVMLLGSIMSTRGKWVVLVAPPIAVALSQIYLGLHWFSDVPAGLMLGLLFMRAAQRIPWTRLRLGPLESFEPASPRTILGITVLISGLLLASTFPLKLGIMCSLGLAAIGILWVIRRYQRYKRALQAESETTVNPPVSSVRVPTQNERDSERSVNTNRHDDSRNRHSHVVVKRDSRRDRSGPKQGRSSDSGRVRQGSDSTSVGSG